MMPPIFLNCITKVLQTQNMLRKLIKSKRRKENKRSLRYNVIWLRLKYGQMLKDRNGIATII